MNSPILIPPVTLARLEALITQRQQIDGQIDATILTLRDALGVPDHYLIGDIRYGFVPPAEQEQAIRK